MDRVQEMQRNNNIADTLMIDPEPVTMQRQTDDPDAGAGRFWHVATFVVGGLALLKGIRLPSRWAATQAQIDYSQGFVKRGLFGTVVTDPLHLWIYNRFAVVSYVLLAVLAVLLVLLVVKTGMAKRLGGAEVLAVFFGGYGVSTLANTVGYMDVPLAIVAIGILLVRNPMLRIALALPLTIVALLIHEMFLFVFLPVLILSFFLQGMGEETLNGKRRVMAAGLILGAIAFLTCVKLARMPSMTGTQLAQMIQRIAERVDFKPRPDFYNVMVISSDENLSIMKIYFRMFDWYMKQLASLLIFGPTVVILLLAAKDVLKRSRLGAQRGIFAMIAVCGCSPLAMHAFGWDVGRWNGLVCLTSFLALVVTVRFTTGPPLASSRGRRRLAAMVLLCSMASGGLLMWREDKVFPAYPQLKKFKNQIHEMSLTQIVNLSD
jgi:hypothetical protein